MENLDIEALAPKMEEAASLMAMLSHPVRLRILCLMADREHHVQALADAARLSQPAVSHHLKKLRDSGLVQTRRDAQTIYYSLRGTEVGRVLETLQSIYCPEVVAAPVEQNRR